VSGLDRKSDVDWRRLARERNVSLDVARGLWAQCQRAADIDIKLAERLYVDALTEAAGKNASPEPGRQTLVDAKGVKDPSSLGPGKSTLVLAENYDRGPAGTAAKSKAGPRQASAKAQPGSVSAEKLYQDLAKAAASAKAVIELLKQSDDATIMEALQELREIEGPEFIKQLMSVADGTIGAILSKFAPELQPPANAAKKATSHAAPHHGHAAAVGDKAATGGSHGDPAKPTDAAHVASFASGHHESAAAKSTTATTSAAHAVKQPTATTTSATSDKTAPTTAPSPSMHNVATPVGGINLSGFIDNSDGANLRTGPRERGGELVIDTPLPPATRVFVSGTYPGASQWWYVTAFMPSGIARGYVQDVRVNTALPEPLAKLYQVKSGDTAQHLASKEYGTAVRDGHDLRYFENVLLKVNHGRAGIKGHMQDNDALSAFNMDAMKKGRSSDIELVSGHRIWLVSPAFARTLEGDVPDGSLTNGGYAKVKRFVGHIVDIVKSVTESPHHLGAVAGQYAQAIRDHLPEIIGIMAGFIAAEALSAFLAATPTGVGQIAAVVIQLALSAFGVSGMVQASIAAAGHAEAWLTTSWSANGKDAKITAASVEFLHMLVSIAMAALAYTGAKGNMGNAVSIAKSMPPIGMVPAMAVAETGGMRMPVPGTGGASAGAGVKLGLPGPQGAVGTAMAMTGKPEGGAKGESSTVESSDNRAGGTAVKTGTDVATKAAKQSARSAAGNVTKTEVGRYIFEPAQIVGVENRVRAQAQVAAEDAFNAAVADGKTLDVANGAANKAAKLKGQAIALDEAEHAAMQKAAQTVEQGRTMAAHVDASTNHQIADFGKSVVGNEAKRVASEVKGMSEADFIAKMKSEVSAKRATEKTITIVGPPAQQMKVYEYPEGTVVRYKPLGDGKRLEPAFSIEVKKDISLPDRGPNDIAFKVTEGGQVVPKGPKDVANPYPKGSKQAETYEQALMDAGHRTLSK
jgi:hypothetical protein